MFVLTTKMRDKNEQVVFDTTHATLEDAKSFAERLAQCDWSGGANDLCTWSESGYVSLGPDCWDKICFYGEETWSNGMPFHEREIRLSIRKV